MRFTEEQLRAILIAGAAGGAAAVVPPLSLGNCLCCLWAWGTGALAVVLVRRRQELPEPQVPRLGLSAGAYGGLVASVLQQSWRLMTGPPDPAAMEELRRILPDDFPAEGVRMFGRILEGGQAGLVGALVSALLLIAVFALFGALGAALWSRLSRPVPSRTDGPTEQE